MIRALRPHRFGLAVARFAAYAITAAAVRVTYDTQVVIHRATRIRPVCTIRGHTFDLELVACVRCDTPYNRVRDCRRPR